MRTHLLIHKSRNSYSRTRRYAYACVVACSLTNRCIQSLSLAHLTISVPVELFLVRPEANMLAAVCCPILVPAIAGHFEAAGLDAGSAQRAQVAACFTYERAHEPAPAPGTARGSRRSELRPATWGASRAFSMGGRRQEAHLATICLLPAQGRMSKKAPSSKEIIDFFGNELAGDGALIAVSHLFQPRHLRLL